VTDVAAAGRGVDVTRVGPRQQPFARPAPKTLDPQLLPDFLPAFNVLQDVSPEGDNLFIDVAEQVGFGGGPACIAPPPSRGTLSLQPTSPALAGTSTAWL
jgi:hypothetical protein